MFKTVVLLLLWSIVGSRGARAQDQNFRFQPPSPPPLDVEFDDDDDDFGDDFGRPPGVPPGAPAVVPPGTPPPPGASPPPDAGAAGGGGGDFGSGFVSAGKFRFKVVAGEFWQKGKKRTRGKEMRVDGDQDSRARAGGPK